MLPRNLWRGTSKALPSGTASSHDQSCDKMVALPTGRVVAVINRNPRNIVATFPVSNKYYNNYSGTSLNGHNRNYNYKGQV